MNDENKNRVFFPPIKDQYIQRCMKYKKWVKISKIVKLDLIEIGCMFFNILVKLEFIPKIINKVNRYYFIELNKFLYMFEINKT